MTLLLATTLVPLVALGWLGWRMPDQDRVLEDQRMQNRLEAAGGSEYWVVRNLLGAEPPAGR